MSTNIFENVMAAIQQADTDTLTAMHTELTALITAIDAKLAPAPAGLKTLSKVRRIKTDEYNEKRYGKPWLATISSWAGSNPELQFVPWRGDEGCEGFFEVELRPGQVLKRGQKDHRNPNGTANDFFVITDAYKLVRVGKADAHDAYQAFIKG